MNTSPLDEWTKLDALKSTLVTRCENYASLTIKKVCLEDGFNRESTDQTHDFQSLGAQAVNHLTNKLMLALFAPSRPFFRVQPGKDTKAQMAAAGVPEAEFGSILATMEREAVRELDNRAQRPKLYTALRHLIVTGNVLLFLGKDSIRVMGIRYFCVKRTAAGKLHTLVIKERVKFDELAQDVQAAVPGRYSDDHEVDHIKLIKLQPNGDYFMQQSVDNYLLPEKFNGKWPAEALPYLVLTWDLADESDYGTGLVEEYIGDLETISALSESVVDGAILGTEYRWLVNPTGYTSADDLNESKNGDALPGTATDITPTQGGNPQAIQIAANVLASYEQRVSRGFLMQSGVTRQAERVTAEEVRLTAQELETAFGGVYSTLAADMQQPIANWLLDAAGSSIKGTDLKVSVVTGLEALSRNGDLENLRLALSDLASFSALPPEMQARIKFQPLAAFVGQGRGVDLTPFLKSDQEFQQEQQAAAQSRVAEQSAIAAGQEAAANPGVPEQ